MTLEDPAIAGSRVAGECRTARRSVPTGSVPTGPSLPIRLPIRLPPKHTTPMSESIGRKRLVHELPPDLSSNPELEVYFITICCTPRGLNQLAHDDVWEQIRETLHHRHAEGLLVVKMTLAMPDHLHGLFSFPAGAMTSRMAAFKSWTAKRTGVCWQRDFFDHRIRSWEDGIEKLGYIMQNPVRAGLVTRAEDWPFQWQPG